MAFLANYIRNIAVFMIFASFVTIICPSKKFEQYINLVLGIIMIFVVAAPLAGIITSITGSSGNILRDMHINYDRAVLARQIADADQAGRDAIIAEYRSALTEQLRRVVDTHGTFSLQDAYFDIDVDENFGKILSIHAVLTTRTVGRQPLISIDPVRIEIGIGTRGLPASSDATESPQILTLKNAISDFYNLDMSNIILETRDD